MWTDPPYGVEYEGKTKDKLSIKNDGASELGVLLDGAFSNACSHALRDGAAVYVCHPAGANSLEFYRSLEDAGFKLRQALVWVKNTFALGRSDYHYRHEPIWFGYKPTETGRLGRGGEGWHGDNSQDSVFEVDKPARNAEHPTMKPVALVQKMLLNSTKKGELVYEPFGGSGSTLLAAVEMNRRCVAIEIDPGYCDVIVQRWEEFTGGKAKKAE
ncbi:MAG: site-specific DNA-methyltransferase [Myxococcales bacterium]|nr:site-specific DNA-methyltransferase [Myxococcales bacterium]